MIKSSILAAAATGQLEVVRTLFSAALNSAEAFHEALQIAAANGHLAIVRYLHQSGCDLQASGHRALLLAAANGRREIVAYLHENGCDIRAANDAPLAAAAAKNHLNVVRHLHQAGADLSICLTMQPELLLSVENRDTAEYLDEQGVVPGASRLVELLQAIGREPALAVRTAIQNVDMKAHSGLIAEAAAKRGDLVIMVFLHQRGCDILANRQAAFTIGAAEGHIAILQYLHENGAAVGSDGGEALRAAVENGHIRAVVFLAERGADITSIDGETLEQIRFNGHTRIFNYLADSGLDAISRFRPEIAAMRHELDHAKPVYRPSKLWEFFNDVNLEQLRRGSIQNFKRSINQNYFNFLPHSLLDPQLSRIGMWWARHPTLTPFRIKVFDPDIVPHSKLLLPVDRRVFSLGHRNPLLSWISRHFRIDLGRALQLTLYRWLVSMLWDYTSAHDRLGLVKRLSEPRIGSPIDVYYGPRLVSQDLAHSILEANSILGAIPEFAGECVPTIAEVGAGYGRLGYVLLHALKCKYVVFDIPPGLFVSQWYLAETFPDKRIFRFRHFEHFEEIESELAQADIAFFSANQIELIPAGYFDLTINISSLHELRPDQIDNMLGQIYRVTRKFVYLKQYKNYVNPYDGLRILEDSYKLASSWKHRYYRDDGVDRRFFETLIEREAPLSIRTVYHPWSAPTGTGEMNVVPPTVSILLANYNNAEYLPTSLAAICNQTYASTELIIVDDGSLDESVAVIQEYAQQFPNVRLLRNSSNRGLHFSIQRALRAARGDYIVWAAADDLLLPTFIERSLDVLTQHPRAGLCFSRLAVFVDGTDEVRHYTGKSHGAAFEYGDQPRYLSPKEISTTLSRHYIWMSGNTVVARRRALLEMDGFEKELRWHSDWFAYYTIALRYGACVIPETLAMMRERRNTYSRSGMGDPKVQRKVLCAIFDAVKSAKYRDILPVFRRCQSLLSPFGRQAVYAGLPRPKHWDLVHPFAIWQGSRFLAQFSSRLRSKLALRHRLGLLGRRLGRLLRRRA